MLVDYTNVFLVRKVFYFIVVCKCWHITVFIACATLDENDKFDFTSF